MVSRSVYFSYALQLFVMSVGVQAAEQESQSQNKQILNQTAQLNADKSSDSIADLFPVQNGEVAPSQQQPPQQHPPLPIQPSYESWDVLRQYPRYVPLPAPTVIEEKASELKEIKEKPNV